MTSAVSEAEFAMAALPYLSGPFFDGVFRDGHGWAATRIACQMLGCPEETLLFTLNFRLCFRQSGEVLRGADYFLGTLLHICAIGTCQTGMSFYFEPTVQ